MKTRNNEQKSGPKIGQKLTQINGNSVKNKLKLNLKLTSNERLCNRCKIHEHILSIKGHNCSFINCDCVKCKDYNEKLRRRNESNAKKRLIEKKSQNESLISEAFVINLKKNAKSVINNKSIKSLNKTVDNSINPKKKNKNKLKNNAKVKSNPNNEPLSNGNNEVNGNQDIVIDEELTDVCDDNESTPPELVPQNSIVITNQKSSTITREEQMANNETTQSYPLQTSAAVCAKYLKAGEEFSRQLAKNKLTDDEMMGCLKYYIVSSCLGDVEIATQKFIYALQEIRSGALYNIQHPQHDQQINGTQNACNTTVANTLVLNSTFNGNYRSINPINYNPAFTPIRPNLNHQ